jgi:predicted dehydrogenase
MKSSGAPLRVGVIGFGARVNGVCKQLTGQDPDFRVAAVADPRTGEIKEKKNPLLADTAFYPDADAMLAGPKLDGLMIGTKCDLHTDMAVKVATAGLPLFLEKPVSTTFDQVKRLHAAAPAFTAPVVVSFPLRVSPLVRRVKEIIDSGTLGTIEHVVAFNDVPYGDVYFGGWYRNYAISGGLFLQKATHDFDYMAHLVGSTPRQVCAMNSQRVWGPGGKPDAKPFDLMCHACGEKGGCTESPYSGDASMLPPKSAASWGEWRACLYSQGIKNEDSGNAIIEYHSGVQASYTQNFFARGKAARRGARLFGYRGTIEFDWYTNKISIMRHDRKPDETIDLSGAEEHFGGDAELCKDFLAALKTGAASRTPLATGINSALTCLWARESANQRKFFDVVMPQ